MAQDALRLAHDRDCVRLLCNFVVKSRLLKELGSAHVVVLILVLLQKLSQLLLSQHFQGVGLALQFLLQDFDLVVLLLFEFHDLQSDLVLAELFGLYLLLPL